MTFALFPGFPEKFIGSDGAILSLAHLKWGLYRLYVDALLYFGNIRTAFRRLRDLSFDEIEAFFRPERFDTDAIKRRGPSLPLKPIAKDDRYLIFGDGVQIIWRYVRYRRPADCTPRGVQGSRCCRQPVANNSETP